VLQQLLHREDDVPRDVPAAVVVEAPIGKLQGAYIAEEAAAFGYAIGRRWGRRLLTGTVGRWVRHDHLDRAERFLAERGGKAVFVGRFTAALRALVPGMAGMSRLHYGRFLAWNVLGGVLWATAFVVLGYLAGSQYQRLEHYANLIGLALLVAIAAFLVVRHRRAKRIGAAGSSGAGRPA